MNRQDIMAKVDAMIDENPWIYASPDSVEAIVDCVIAAYGDDSAEFRVRKDAPETSKAIVDKIRTGSLQDRLLTQFRWSALGWTDDELEQRTGRSHQSVSATRNTLMRKGYVVDSGNRRKTRSGNDAIVWVWTGKGI